MFYWEPQNKTIIQEEVSKEVISYSKSLYKLNKEDGRTIVMVTHNEEQAKQTSRTIRFFDGRQVQ